MDRNIPTAEEADEIEITAEMVEAGVTQFLRYDPEAGEPEDVVKAIFVAMLSAGKNDR